MRATGSVNTRPRLARLIEHDKHLSRVERRLRRAGLAFDEARVAEVCDADLQRRAAAAAVDVEEFVGIAAAKYRLQA